MNNEWVTGRQKFLPLTKQNEIEKWVKDVRGFSRKSIYKLTWRQVHKNLHKLGTQHFFQAYGFSSRRSLQLFIARSNLWQANVTLNDFETSGELELFRRVKSHFFNKVERQANFNPKKHKLSTIHYYIYHYNLNFAALSLGFSTKQNFLNFFVRTLYLNVSIETLIQSLNSTIKFLAETDPAIFHNKLSDFYDKPLTQSNRFVKYNATLEELKRILETEITAMVVASLGEASTYVLNKKLQRFLDISLHDLKQKSWEELEQNTPHLSSFRGTKLYQVFSTPLKQTAFTPHLPRPLRPGICCHCQFFSSSKSSGFLRHPSLTNVAKNLVGKL